MSEQVAIVYYFVVLHVHRICSIMPHLEVHSNKNRICSILITLL